MITFENKNKRMRERIKGKFRQAPSTIKEKEVGNRRFSLKERKKLEREFFGRKYWKRSGLISEDEYKNKLKRLTSGRLKAKTPEDKDLIKRKLKYLKKIIRTWEAPQD